MKYVKLFFSYRARQFEKHGFEKNAFKVFSSRIRRSNMTWQKVHDFHNFSNSGLKFNMRISECICNRIMMKKKNRLFDPFTGEAPLKSSCLVTLKVSKNRLPCFFSIFLKVVHGEKYHHFEVCKFIIVWDHDASVVLNHEFCRFILHSAP